VGVILPATLTFNTGVPEIMETVVRACRVRLKGESGLEGIRRGAEFQRARQLQLRYRGAGALPLRLPLWLKQRG
jgi:uncharacterized protein YaiE (UPF0345 family)